MEEEGLARNACEMQLIVLGVSLQILQCFSSSSENKHVSVSLTDFLSFYQSSASPR